MLLTVLINSVLVSGCSEETHVYTPSSAGSRTVKLAVPTKVESSALTTVVGILVWSEIPSKLRVMSMSVSTSVLSTVTVQTRAAVVPSYSVPALLGAMLTAVAGRTGKRTELIQHTHTVATL